MSREPDVWWNKQKRAWCSDVGGQRKALAKGKANEKEAQDMLRALQDEQALLVTVGGKVSIAGLCESFLADAEQNLVLGRDVEATSLRRIAQLPHHPRLERSCCPAPQGVRS